MRYFVYSCMLRYASVGGWRQHRKHFEVLYWEPSASLGAHHFHGILVPSWAIMEASQMHIYLSPKNVLSSLHKDWDATSAFAYNYYYCCCYYHCCKLFHCCYHLSLRKSRSPAMCSRPLYDPSSPWHMCIRQPLNHVTATPSSLSSITVIPVMR